MLRMRGLPDIQMEIIVKSWIYYLECRNVVGAADIILRVTISGVANQMSFGSKQVT